MNAKPPQRLFDKIEALLERASRPSRKSGTIRKTTFTMASEFGAVVLLRFPFTDFVGFKQRPPSSSPAETTPRRVQI